MYGRAVLPKQPQRKPSQRLLVFYVSQFVNMPNFIGKPLQFNTKLVNETSITNSDSPIQYLAQIPKMLRKLTFDMDVTGGFTWKVSGTVLSSDHRALPHWPVASQ